MGTQAGCIFFFNKFLPSFSLLMRPSQVPLLKRAVIAFSALTLHLPIIYALAVSCNNNNYNIYMNKIS